MKALPDREGISKELKKGGVNLPRDNPEALCAGPEVWGLSHTLEPNGRPRAGGGTIRVHCIYCHNAVMDDILSHMVVAIHCPPLL